jgi:hypothetical protein
LSRTAHHKRWKHWNVKKPVVCFYGSWSAYHGLSDEEETIGNVQYDLRFYAGCKRTPKKISIVHWYHNYAMTWGHYGGAAKGIAHEQRCLTRGEERAYGQDVKKLHRAGEVFDDILEPEGRTRHRALWDAC